MNIRSNNVPVFLGKDQAARLTHARGATVRCRQGLVWVTQDGDPRDIVLEAGNSFVLDRNALAIVFAMRSSSVVVQPAPRRAGLFAHALDRLRSIGSTPAAHTGHPDLAH